MGKSLLFSVILSETGKKGAHFHTFFPCHFTASCPAAPGGLDRPAAAGAQDVVPGGFQGFPPFPQPEGGNFARIPGEKAVFAGILAPSGRARWKSLPFPSGGMGITRWKRWKTCIFTVDCTECKILSKTARLSAARLTGKGEGMGCFLCKRPFFPLPGFASPRRKTRGKTGFRGKSYSHFFPCKTGLNIV